MHSHLEKLSLAEKQVEYNHLVYWRGFRNAVRSVLNAGYLHSPEVLELLCVADTHYDMGVRDGLRLCMDRHWYVSMYQRNKYYQPVPNMSH